MKLVSKMSCCAALLCGAILFPVSASFAAITGPYAWDANTLHLWHIDEDAVPVADHPSVGTAVPLTALGSGGGNSVGATSYAGFGKAYSGVAAGNTGLFAQTPTNSSADDTPTTSFWNQSTGAFTYEAIIRIDFDPSTVSSASDFAAIMTMDGDSTTRPFTLYLNPQDGGSYSILMSNGSATVKGESPTLTMAQNHWYHIAVTYNGVENTAGNMKMYFTDMGTQATPNTSATVANLVHSTNFTADLAGAAGDFVLGAEARSTPGSSWLGLIDEVRISDIARGADQFIFTVPEPSSFILIGIGLAALGAVRLRRKTA